MSECWRALVLGGVYWVALMWLPFSIDPSLFVVLLISVATRHEWAALSLVVLMGISAESAFLIRPGIVLTAYLMAFAAMRAVIHRVRHDSFWMRLWCTSGGAVLATIVVQQLYVESDLPWQQVLTLSDICGLAVSVVTAAALVPVLHGWCDGQWRRPRGLVRFS